MKNTSKWVVSWGVVALVVLTACEPREGELPPGAEELEQQRQAVSERTGDMQGARMNHSATLLSNGKLLVAGGDSESSVFSFAELYDPTTGTWAGAGYMSIPRAHHCAVLLNDGRVLVAGGYTYSYSSGSTSVSATSELYDPSTGKWTATGSLGQQRYRHACTRLADGRVIAAGGLHYMNTTALYSFEIYDPATGTWTFGRTSMPGTRRSHSAILLNDGRVAVLGGLGWNGTTNVSTSVQLFDPATSTWSSGGSLTVSRLWGDVAKLDDGRILLAGGSDSPTTAEIYDPVTQTSTPTGSMATGRSYFTLTRFAPGRILAVGGSQNTTVTTIEDYNVSTGTWTTLETLRSPRAYHSATLLQGAPARLLIAGGTGPTGRLAASELYRDGPDVTPPTIIQVCPSQGNTLSTTATLCANASDNVGVTRVEYYRDDGILLGSSTQVNSSFILSWDTRTAANGSHTLYGRAYDAAGNAATSASVSVTVNNDVTPPTTTLTGPTAGSTLSLTATLTASATDDRSVSRVEFYQGNVLIGTSSYTPYNVSWDTTLVPNGSYTLTSRAYDSTGNVGTSSGVVVTVNNETVPPTTWLTSPAPGTSVAMTVTLTAEASDNVGVTRVEFYRGSTLLGTDSTAPYSITWNTQSVPNGGYALTSKAYDAARNVGTSAGVTVTVGNAPPSTELIVNGGFEGSASPWVLSGYSSYVAGGSYPHSGTGYNELGASNSVTGSTEQVLTLPGSGAPSLSFWLNVTTTENTSTTTQFDRLYIEVLGSSGTVLGTLATFSNANWGTAGVYSQKTYSLSAYVGQSIKLRFRTTQDSSLPTTFRIDDVLVK